MVDPGLSLVERRDSMPGPVPAVTVRQACRACSSSGVVVFAAVFRCRMDRIFRRGMI